MVTPYERFKDNKIMEKILAFINSVYFLLVPFVLALISNLFSLELLVFTIIVLLAVFILIFNYDTKPIVPFFGAMYCATSKASRPELSNLSSIFIRKDALIYIVIIASIVVAAFILRAIIYKDYRKYRIKTYKLFYGYAALFLGFLLSGLFSSGMSLKNTGFSLLEFACLSFIYFYFLPSIDWSKDKNKYYFFYAMALLGALVVLEVLYIYLTTPSIYASGSINKSVIYTGWGIQNNMGAMIALSLPFVFYLAIEKKKGWLYLLLSLVYYFVIIITLSRNAILVATIGMIVGAFLSIIVPEESKKKITNASIVIGTLICLTILLIIFKDKVLAAFSSMINNFFDPSCRDAIYAYGIKQFLGNPIFGIGFYDSPEDLTVVINMKMPGRYHDVFIQFLASTGLLGTLAFVFHLYQVVSLTFKNRSKEKIFLWLGAFYLIALSVLDNHFFNLGPGLVYASILTFLEGEDKKINLMKEEVTQP